MHLVRVALSYPYSHVVPTNSANFSYDFFNTPPRPFLTPCINSVSNLSLSYLLIVIPCHLLPSERTLPQCRIYHHLPYPTVGTSVFTPTRIFSFEIVATAASLWPRLGLHSIVRHPTMATAPMARSQTSQAWVCVPLAVHSCRSRGSCVFVYRSCYPLSSQAS
jgi:hypothetical protein